MTSVVVGQLAHVWEAVHTKRRVDRNQIVYVGLDHSRDWRLGLSAIIIIVPLAREYLSHLPVLILVAGGICPFLC